MENCEFKRIKLEKPKLTGGMPLFEAFAKRKTERNFDTTKFLSLSQLSQLLWSCYGSNREGGFKVVPSAFHINPLTVYCFMKCGTFKYCPETEELEPIKEGDNRDIVAKLYYVKLAPLSILIVADLKKENPLKSLNIELNDEARRVLSYVDAAHCCQNIYLFCTSEGLKCVEGGYFDNEKILNFLGLDVHTFRCVSSLYAGY